MPALQVGTASVPLNEAGFVLEFDGWNEDVALAMSREDGLELTDCHWAAIRFLREYYATHLVAASPRLLIKEVGHQLSQHKCTYHDVKLLFPRGGIKQACRLAGLPVYYCHAC